MGVVKKAKAKMITVKVGNFDMDTLEVEIEKGSTVQTVLDEAEQEVAPSQTVWVNGSPSYPEQEVEDGDFIQVVGKKDYGMDDEDDDEEEDED